ncbi:hypothetical protein E5676_scaffold248G002010 [Cucumis melo var. makuwa]|uniref:Uncharacterized protein n=2 Tax=Cucumis melo TaxID=3656 RepID=A0A5D3BIQ1_CUCMM|nr:hypothetical protein E5676_scaffold248G002010 [Cucumis melo var. makuwa]
MDGHGYDPFDSLAKLCVISHSQEDILRHSSFAGAPKSLDASGFPASQFLQRHPTCVSTASPPESLEQREQLITPDAYRPPPEQSGGRRPVAVDDPSVQDAAAAVGGGCVSNVPTGVDLGKNDELGFLEVQSTQQTDEIEIIGVRRSKVSESGTDGEAESASKRLKLSNEALGKDSSVPLVGLESGRESILIEKSVPVGEESGKIDDGKVSNGEETHCNKNKEKLTEKKVENSHPEEPGEYDGVLNCDPWRETLTSTLNGLISKEKDDDASSSGESGRGNSIIMEILKIVSQVERSDEDEKLANMDLVEVAMSRGMTFPRPCWWPEEYGYNRFGKKN